MWRTIGHDRAVKVLQRSLEEGRLSHAYLLVGPRSVGKMTLATDIAQAVNCLEDEVPCGSCTQCERIDRGLHADVRVVGLASNGADGRIKAAIGIDQVREVQREASLKPFEGRYRVFIFDGAEHLSEEAANCLLKTLEEPPDQVGLVLLASSPEVLLPTLVSRCQLLELRPVPPQLLSSELKSRYGTDSGRAEETARLSGGRPGWAIEAVKRPEPLKKLEERLDAIEGVLGGGAEERFAYAASLSTTFGRDRDSARQELAMWLSWWRDILLANEREDKLITHLSRIDKLQAVAGTLSSAQIVRAINTVQETIENLERNVNPRLALDNLMLALPQIREV